MSGDVVESRLVEGKRGLLSYLYATIFLTSTAYGTVTFMIPVYAEELGASYIALGVIGTVGSMVYTIMTLFSGFLLDRFERIRFYLAFTALGVIIVFLFCLATNVSQIILFRGLLGVVAASFWVTASTLTADISPPENLTQSVGRYNLSWIAGFFVGPFLGGFVSDAFGFPSLFAMLSVLVIVSVAIILLRLMDLKLQNQTQRQGFNVKAMRGLAKAYLTLFPFTIVLGIYMAILPGHMRGLGIVGSSIGLLLTMTNGVRGLGFFNAERFVRWGTRRSLGLAACLLCGAFYIVASSKTTIDFVAPLAIYGFAAGITTPVILDYIAHRAPREALGTAMGVHEGVYGVGMSIGPIAGGVIAEAFQPAALYFTLSILSLTIIPLSFGMRKTPLDGSG